MNTRDLVRGKQLPEPGARRALRLAAGLTMTEVAHQLGVTRQAVSYWESGKNNPTGKKRRAYSKFLTELAHEVSGEQ